MKVLERAIYSALSGRAQLTTLLAAADNIFPDKIPMEASLPAVVYSVSQPGRDEYTYGTTRAFEELRYLVKGVVAGYDPEAANDIAEQINIALTASKIAISGHTNMLGQRVGRVSYPETGTAGDHYQHRGGIYRWLVQ